MQLQHGQAELQAVLCSPAAPTPQPLLGLCLAVQLASHTSALAANKKDRVTVSSELARGA